MTKLFFIILLLLSNLHSNTKNIESKISKNKKILNKNLVKKEKTSIIIKDLAKRINKQNVSLSRLEKKIKVINSDINKHENLLHKSQNKLSKLRTNSKKLVIEKNNNEKRIVDIIIENFSTTIALQLASKNSLKELIDLEIYTLLSQNTKDKILRLNNNYDLVTYNTKKNKKDIKKIATYIKDRKKKKKSLKNLKKEEEKSKVTLEKEHKSYQRALRKTIKQQNSLKSLLSNLNIIKKKEARKLALERKRRLAKLLREEKRNKKKTKKNTNSEQERNQKYAKNLNLDVKKIGSSTSGIKIVKYRGVKTITPLKSFKVVKNFGTYYDPVYKIKLFNESIILKTNKPKAKVVSVLNGKVVYAKKNSGMLENVVIVQHKNGLHTIYSHLDEIAPTLKVGKWIKQGYVVGRVDKNLTFQATKNSSHIDPKDLFRI